MTTLPRERPFLSLRALSCADPPLHPPPFLFPSALGSLEAGRLETPPRVLKAERQMGEGTACVGTGRPAFLSPNRRCTPSPFQLERSGWPLAPGGAGWPVNAGVSLEEAEKAGNLRVNASPPETSQFLGRPLCRVSDKGVWDW